MAPALSLSVSNLPICKRQDPPKDAPLITKSTSKENPYQKMFTDLKFRRRKLLNSGGMSLIGGAFAQPARAEPESPGEATSSRMSYSRFLEYLEQGGVRKVDLFDNGTVAIAEIYNPALEKIQRVKIQMPGLPQEQLRKLKEKDVDFAAHLMEMNITAALLDT